MKKIQAFTIWVNGKTVTAYYLALSCNSDNLLNQAVFYWAFYDIQGDQPGNKLTDGNLIMSGDDYDAWDTNEYAWNWAASSLGVTFDITAPAGDAPALKKGKKS